MFGLAISVVVIAGLYFGQEVLVPLALAILLSFALAPPVRWLRRIHVPRIAAVLVVVLVAFSVIGAIAALIGWQVADLAASLPRYQTNIERKIEAFREAPPGGDVIGRVASTLERLGRQIEEPAEKEVDAADPLSDTEEAPPEPILVRIAPPSLEPMALARTIIGPLIPPLTTAGIVIVFVVFMLLQRADLRDRLIRLAGTRDMQRTTKALDDAAKRVGHYLLMQLIVNATYAIPVTIGLYFIGVPNPLLWGLLCMILRFVPYIGPVVGAAFPIILSVAVDPGWTMLMWTGALFLVIELISNNIVEPVLYGASTGLSPVAIIVAAIFWTWLWGPVGLLLSTPLTVCLVVLGRHIPQMTFLDVMLGNEPALSLRETLYQRLLVGDPDDATERAEEELKTHRLVTFYDEVAVPALALAEHDRAEGNLDDKRRLVVSAGMQTLLDNLSEHEDVDSEELDEAEPADPTSGIAVAPGWSDRAVLVAGARGNLDAAAAGMLVQLLEKRGFGVVAPPFEALRPENVGSLDLDGVRIICLSYLNGESLAHARYLVRRLRRRRPDVPIMTCFWTFDDEEIRRRDPKGTTRADRVAVSLRDAMAQIVEEMQVSSVDGDRTPELADVASRI